MTTHDKNKIISAAKEADPGFDGGPDSDGTMTDSIVGFEAVERFYTLALEAGRQLDAAETYKTSLESYKAGFENGAASRDNEVAELKAVSDHNLKVYQEAAQSIRDDCNQLRQQLSFKTTECNEWQASAEHKLTMQLMLERRIEGMEQQLAEVADKVREECASAAWLHYMDVCKKHGHSPNVERIRDFCSADAIRAAKEQAT